MSKYLIVLVAFLALGAPAQADRGSAASAGSSAAATSTPQENLQGFLAPDPQGTEAEQLARLQRAVRALEAKGMTMATSRRERLAKAALKASRATGVDPLLLIAVARQESDFRSLQVVSPKCYSARWATCDADCGVTQHHIFGTRNWVKQRCRQLARNIEESFLLSAKELRSHIDWCQTHKWYRPIQQCILGRYNAGPFYPTARNCERWQTQCYQQCPRIDWSLPDEAAKQQQYRNKIQCHNQCYVASRKCRRRANYWIGVLCFDYGARRSLRAKRSCRYAWTLAGIPSFYPAPASPSASR